MVQPGEFRSRFTVSARRQSLDRVRSHPDAESGHQLDFGMISTPKRLSHAKSGCIIAALRYIRRSFLMDRLIGTFRQDSIE